MSKKENLSKTDIYIHYILRVSAFLCFVGHGAFGFITKEGWVKFFTLVNIPRDVGFQMMPLIGGADVIVGLSVLLFPTRFALAYMVFWAFMTALLRPAVGMGFCEFFERAGNYGVPFALLFISSPTLLAPGWFKRVKPVRLEGKLFKNLTSILQLTTASLLMGHGVIAFVHHKESLALHFSAAPVLPDLFNVGTLVVASGLFEILLGLLILFRPFLWATLLAFGWKVFTEALFPLSGDYFWEFVERAGSYGAPLALSLILLSRKSWKFSDFWHCDLVQSLSTGMDVRRAREVVYACSLLLAITFLTGVRTIQPLPPTADAP